MYYYYFITKLPTKMMFTVTCIFLCHYRRKRLPTNRGIAEKYNYLLDGIKTSIIILSENCIVSNIYISAVLLIIVRYIITYLYICWQTTFTGRKRVWTGPAFVFTSRSDVAVAAATSAVSRWLTDRQNDKNRVR